MSKNDFWRYKRIFLTGHTGFKGAWLCKILEMAGADVTGYALEPPTQPNLYEICKPKVHSVIGDIRDFDTLFAAYKMSRPEVVIHMAAQPLVIASYREPRYTYDTNVMGTVNILECVRLTDTAHSVLNITTDKVYCNRERAEAYCEDEMLNGYDPYANSKSCSELITSSYNNSFFRQMGVAVSTMRSGNVIGGGDFSENRIIPDCAKSAAVGERVKIRNPRSIRPYQHVLDTLFAYLLAARTQYEDLSVAGCYNVGPDARDCLTNSELATLFCDAWGAGVSWENVSADTPHEDNLLALDCAKIRNVFSWRPQWNITRAVNETALWYKTHFSGGDPNAVMTRQIEEFMNGGPTEVKFENKF